MSSGKAMSERVDVAIRSPSKVRIDLLERDPEQSEQQHEVAGSREPRSPLDVVVRVRVVGGGRRARENGE